MESLGQRLVKARNKKGLSQEEFANELNVSRQMVSKWELDMAVPRMSRIDKICETLDITANELINIKEDNSGEEYQNDSLPVANKISINYKTLLRRAAMIFIIFFILLITTYLILSIRKLVTLSSISSKVEKYANLENYYCKIKSYDDNGQQSVSEIWYKDGVYKLIDETNQNNQPVRTIEIINLNDNSRYQIIEDEKLARKRNLLQPDVYENGMYMYTQFPSELRREDFDYKKFAFGFNSFSYFIEDDLIGFGVNDEFIYLDKETYLPVSKARVTDSKQKRLNQRFTEYYEITLDSVKDEDITIPEGYNLIG